MERHTSVNYQPMFLSGGTNVQMYVYKRRWYVLLLFCLLAILEMFILDTWRSITCAFIDAYPSISMKIGYFDIAGIITIGLAIFPLSRFMDNVGKG